MNQILLGLHGLSRCGKDTFGSSLISTGKWEKVSFASPLKRGLSVMLSIPMEDIENPELKNLPDYKFGKSIRFMAQTLGTEWGRQLIADDIWVQLGKEEILKKLGSGMNVVVTDLRFENEAQMVKDMGGHMIMIHRPDNSHAIAASINGVKAHVSDATIPSEYFNAHVINDTSVDEFIKNATYWLERVKNG